MILTRGAEDDTGSNFSEPKYPNYQHREGVFQHNGTVVSPQRGRRSPEGSPDSQLRGSLGLVATLTNRTYGTDAGNRRKFASTLSRIGDYIGTPSHKRFDYSEFQRGPAMNYPEIPGEGYRNRELSQLRNNWGPPSIRERSSRDDSPESRADLDGNASQRGGESPQSPQSPMSIQFPTPPPRAARTGRASTMPTAHRPSPPVDQYPQSSGDIRASTRQRRDTLEVPSSAHINHTRNMLSSTSQSTLALPAGNELPAIVVSSEPDMVPNELYISGASGPNPDEGSPPRT